MSVDEFNTFCSSLAHTHHVVQWGGANVWKVAGKVFAIGGWNQGAGLSVSFKCSDVSFEILKTQPGLRPAPYLASRGMKWIQRTGAQCMKDATLRDYLKESHRLVSLGLPKKVQKALALNQESEPAKAKRRPTLNTPSITPKAGR